MSARGTILDWSEAGRIADTRAALEAGGALPNAAQWREFLDRLLLGAGAIALGAAVVYFVAHNWNDLGRFAKFALVEALIGLAVLAYWRLGPDRAAGKAALLVASICLGALLALFGQTYQTGADTWELFATWAAMMAPWVLVGRFAALWTVWIAVINLAIALYFVTFPGVLGLLVATERLPWTLFVFDTVALAAWELASRRIGWLDERWAPRLLVMASGVTITVLVLHAIFYWREASGLAVAVYPAWLAGIYAAYRKVHRDLMALAGACLSIIVVVTAFLAERLDRGAEAGTFLLIAIVVIAMAGAAGWWLKAVARETPA